VLLGAGCQSFEKKPPPEMGTPPPEEEPAPVPEEPVVEEPVEPAPPDPAPALPDPVPAVPPRQEVPGSWSSVLAQGPGSANVQRVSMVFAEGGVYAGSVLLKEDGKLRYVVADGTWAFADGRLTIKDGTGRSRDYAVAWDGADLELRDGEALLRLRRDPEAAPR
jgi:hypothetical protein